MKKKQIFIQLSKIYTHHGIQNVFVDFLDSINKTSTFSLQNIFCSVFWVAKNLVRINETAKLIGMKRRCILWTFSYLTDIFKCYHLLYVQLFCSEKENTNFIAWRPTHWWRCHNHTRWPKWKILHASPKNEISFF